jgi:hypothetical protein
VTVAQYIPSEVKLDIGGKEVRLSQCTELKNLNNQVFFDEDEGGEKSRWSLRFDIGCDDATEFTLKLRMPWWLKGTPQVMVDGETIRADIAENYLYITKFWQNSTIQLLLTPKLTAEPLPDMPEVAALMDGPIVLAGMTDKDIGLHGDIYAPESFLHRRTTHEYKTYVWKQNTYITRHQPVNIEFKPLYEVTDEVYTVYFSKKK